MLGHEKIGLLHLPTPLEHLKNVSKDLGVNVYCKRDDLTNLATGGNKLRKLEYFLKDALDQGATMLVTVGGAQTNHGRLTAAVATKYGLKAAILTEDEYPGEISANLLLDGMMGCDVHFVKDMKNERRSIIDSYAAAGEKVYYIPVGGSNELGLLGYMECAEELDEQAKAMGIEDATIYATIGSMGTYLGLLLGLKECGSSLSVKGVGIAPFPGTGSETDNLLSDLADYYNRACEFYEKDFGLKPEDIHLTTDFSHGDYNNPVKEVRETMYYMARKEAIIIDPCYTGKTFEALCSDARTGKIAPGDNVIFMHTGGIPGIYTGHHRKELEKELLPHMKV